jgi:hypothetical protein
MAPKSQSLVKLLTTLGHSTELSFRNISEEGRLIAFLLPVKKIRADESQGFQTLSKKIDDLWSQEPTTKI